MFPSWLENHELETEGFGGEQTGKTETVASREADNLLRLCSVMAKKVGARVVGLPNYVVLHGKHKSAGVDLDFSS